MSGTGSQEVTKEVLIWSSEQVTQWLLVEGFQEFVPLIEPHQITGIDLLMLSEQDWRDLINEYYEDNSQRLPSTEKNSRSQSKTRPKPPNTVTLRRLLYRLNRLKISQANFLPPDVGFCLGLHGWPFIPSTFPRAISSRVLSAQALLGNNADIASNNEDQGQSPQRSEEEEFDFQKFRDYVICPNCHQIRMQKKVEIPPERWKTVLAFLYVLLVSWLTAFVMVIVHDRVPDMEKYPPLPDILLDNIPLIPGAFEMCELTGMVLLCLWIIVIIFHKHRWVLMRRFFSLSGTIFLLRCVTMLITSLSVPGKHLACAPRPYGDIWNKMYNAFIIWTGAGLTLQGVRTCGDYMFSGHTVGLTLLNFFITEYTSHIYMLHTFTWICNVFGVFFIVAAHEHYSIDVFVAFYIASRLFMYYHTLANQKLPNYYNMPSKKDSTSNNLDTKNHSPKYDDENEQQQILQFWFPLFTFFESGIEGGKIPNKFEYPFTIADFKAVKHFILCYISKGFNAFNTNTKVESFSNHKTNDLSMSKISEHVEAEKGDVKNIGVRKRYNKRKV